ncbi:hypothetical protein PTW37_10285 [Arthrobacter agilis]|uniref:hypothetical protein n=1 Tax=Arthrobacter agilis TaxID=37921 RepID=UPI00236517DF|nr:hypothetical protein [Arthrobacter agilis]WDF32262.1 hypothetical protein PTW37_10285 [Arthrobacter agilis]
MATPREIAFDGPVVDGAKNAVKYLDLKTSEVHKSTFVNGYGDKRSIGQMLSNIDKNQNVGLAKLEAKISGLVGALAAVAGGQPFDQEKLLADMEAASARGAEAGVRAAIDSVTREETTTVNLKES